MEVITNYQEFPVNAQNCVIALGNFDGVHKGHQVVIKTAVAEAKKAKKPSVVMTFDPHPGVFFNKNNAPFLLYDNSDKIKFISELGVDYLLMVKFNEEFSKISAKDFITQILVNNLKAHHVITGNNFIFGHKRQGNTELLKQYAQEYSFKFTQIEPQGSSEVYSSTLVRKHLKAGKPEKAAEILGRNYHISGKVIHGDKRGRQIGFPTANIALDKFIHPLFGVYAVLANIDNKTYKAVANIGIRPTFDISNPILEVFIFNFNGDIYDKNIHVELKYFIREEISFKNIEDLKARIDEDVITAKKLLG